MKRYIRESLMGCVSSQQEVRWGADWVSSLAQTRQRTSGWQSWVGNLCSGVLGNGVWGSQGSTDSTKSELQRNCLNGRNCKQEWLLCWGVITPLKWITGAWVPRAPGGFGLLEVLEGLSNINYISCFKLWVRKIMIGGDWILTANVPEWIFV